MKDSRNILGLSLVALAIVACGGGPATGGGGAHEGEPSGGDDLAAYEGPISCEEGGADGAVTYTALCNGCHSSYAPGLTDIGWSAAQMRRQIRLGDDGMPAFGEDRIEAGDLECLMTHLVTTGAVVGARGVAEPAPTDG